MVADLRDRLGRAKSTVLAEFVSLSVAEMTALRRRVIESGGEAKVVKNTLLGLAVKAAGVTGLDEALTGPTVVVFGYEDPVAAVKAVADFGQDHRDQWRIKAGVLDGQALSAREVESLARVPSREVLLGQVAGLLATPATRLARVAAEPIAQLARVLSAVEKARGEAA